ncbi:MAG TPA: HAMP domain-containing sensor histidine kinase [Solirubrobacteraceae bacterium]|nr:HAMP domain-containing sensor histidine kinase [Solirubrobacteraceae bacterium]
MRRPRTKETLPGVAVVLGAAFAASVACYLARGAQAGWTSLAILAPVGLLSVLGLQRFLAARTRVGGIRRQLSIGGVIVVGQLLLAVGLFVALMSRTPREGLFAVILAVYAGVVGIWCARAIARGVVGDIEALRRGVEAIDAGAGGGRGRRDPIKIATGGDDELALVAREIEAMAARLAREESSRAKLEAARSELLAAISHDVRTPITSLRLLSEAIDDELVDEPTRREYVTRIGVHVRALGALIDDLFELSRLETGDITWTMERVPLHDLVLETVDAMRVHAEAGSVSMHAELDPDLRAAHANPEQIQRVLFNLIRNAIRHTPADGSVTVRAQAARDTVEVEVRDTGEGIPLLERERVFEAFVQGADRAARSDGSAGLGLAISRAIVEAHGGHIWIDDAAVGTSVRFRLPCAS